MTKIDGESPLRATRDDGVDAVDGEESTATEESSMDTGFAGDHVQDDSQWERDKFRDEVNETDVNETDVNEGREGDETDVNETDVNEGREGDETQEEPDDDSSHGHGRSIHAPEPDDGLRRFYLRLAHASWEVAPSSSGAERTLSVGSLLSLIGLWSVAIGTGWTGGGTVAAAVVSVMMALFVLAGFGAQKFPRHERVVGNDVYRAIFETAWSHRTPITSRRAGVRLAANDAIVSLFIHAPIAAFASLFVSAPILRTTVLAVICAFAVCGAGWLASPRLFLPSSTRTARVLGRSVFQALSWWRDIGKWAKDKRVRPYISRILEAADRVDRMVQTTHREDGRGLDLMWDVMNEAQVVLGPYDETVAAGQLPNATMEALARLAEIGENLANTLDGQVGSFSDSIHELADRATHLGYEFEAFAELQAEIRRT